MKGNRISCGSTISKHSQGILLATSKSKKLEERNIMKQPHTIDYVVART